MSDKSGLFRFQKNCRQNSQYQLESDRIIETLAQHPLFDNLQQIVHELHKELIEPINHVKNPLEERKADYQKIASDFETMRGTALFYPYIGAGIGNGPYVLLEDGSVKLDFISGIGHHYWGHCNKDLQMIHLLSSLTEGTTMQGNLQPSRSGFELISLLTSLSGFDHCFLTTSGAMSGENALKIMFQKAFPKNRVIAFDSCFAGRSLAMSYITDKAAYRKGLPEPFQVDYIPFYNESLGVDESLHETLKALDSHMRRYPDLHAGFCAELIQGEGGFRIGREDYFIPLLSEMRKRGLIIWIDEVQTFARTPSLFAADYFKVMKLADILTLGKVSQVCATLFNNHLKPLPGLISQTFTASSSAIHAALWGIQKSLSDGHFGSGGKIQRLFEMFSSKLAVLSSNYPNMIRGPWGIGSMISFTPFDGDEKRVQSFAKRLFNNGLIGFICGNNPTKIRFLLPVGAVEEQHIDEAVSIIEKTLIEDEKTHNPQ